MCLLFKPKGKGWEEKYFSDTGTRNPESIGSYLFNNKKHLILRVFFLFLMVAIFTA